MQSDWNSFCGDVVLDRFSMVYSDEDSIKDQKYEKIFCNLNYEDFQFQELLQKMHIQRITAHNNKELIILGFSATVVLVCIFV